MNDSLNGLGRRFTRGALATLVALAGWSAATALATDAAPEVAMVPVTALLDHLPGAADKAIYEALSRSLREDGQGAWAHLLQRQAAFLTPQEVQLMALRKNLPLRVSGLSTEQARQAVREAEAVFDPTFVLSVGHTETMTHQRMRFGPVFKRNFQPQDQTIMTNPNNSNPQVVKLGFRNQAQQTVDKDFDLSSEERHGPIEERTVSLTINQQLPWGPQVSLTHVASHQEAYYDSRGNSWNAPWGSTLAGSFWMPAPFAKNFGRYAVQDVALEQGRIAQDRSDWVLRNQINSVLLQADAAYWDLVAALENLLASMKNRELVAEQAQHTRALLKVQRVTQFSMDQMEAELARARLQEEQARQALIDASNTLAGIIDDDPARLREALYLPVAFHERMAARAEVAPENALETALETARRSRPDLHMARLDLDSRQLSLEQAQDQLKPEVTLAGSFSFAQVNDTYGYKSYEKSLSHIANPDQRSFTGSLGYTYPWGNRNAKETLVQARHSLNDGELARSATEDAAARQVGDALANLFNARTYQESASRNLALAEEALDKARRRQQVRGDVDALELTLKMREVLAARSARIAATINAQKAESQLHAAQGTLADHLVSVAGTNDFDRYRVELLQNSHALRQLALPDAAEE